MYLLKMYLMILLYCCHVSSSRTLHLRRSSAYLNWIGSKIFTNKHLSHGVIQWRHLIKRPGVVHQTTIIHY